MNKQLSYNHTAEQLDELLIKGIELANADKGIIQLFNNEEEALRVVAQRGFSNDFLSYFKIVKAFSPSACGRALGLQKPIIIEDVSQDKALYPILEIVKAAGFRSVISTPLVNEDKKVAGIISMYYTESQTFRRKGREIPEEHLLKIAGVLVNFVPESQNAFS